MLDLLKTAISYHNARSLGKAEQAYREVLQQTPNDTQVIRALAQVCYEQGKVGESLSILRDGHAIDPGNINLRFNLASILDLAGQRSEAIDQYLQILALDANNGLSHMNLGVIYLEQNEFELAIKHLHQATLSLDDNAMLAFNLCVAYARIGNVSEAIKYIRLAQKIDPDFDAANHLILMDLLYLPDITDEEIYEEHLKWGEVMSATSDENSDACPKPKGHDRIRVGYVSPDFQRHSVAYFFIPLIKNHDRSRVTCYCYSNVKEPDETTAEIEQAADAWRDISRLNDDEAAQLILADEIDVLIDLAGHTKDNRLSLFIRKLAPVQMTYLGYPTTTGIKTMDFRITDTLADPAGFDKHYTEQLIRLNACFLCYSPPVPSPDIGAVPVITNGYITFGSFNALEKITPQIIVAWAEILNRAPGSRLILKTGKLGTATTQSRIHADFEALGVSKDRVECLGWCEGKLEHLEFYNRLDIALDTYPYHGTTTTCEALWMGVPTVTLAGTRHSSRVGVSLLTTIGTPELIAASMQDYINIAVELTTDLSRLESLKKTLRNKIQSSDLMDGKRITNDLERIFEEKLNEQ